MRPVARNVIILPGIFLLTHLIPGLAHAAPLKYSPQNYSAQLRRGESVVVPLLVQAPQGQVTAVAPNLAPVGGFVAIPASWVSASPGQATFGVNGTTFAISIAVPASVTLGIYCSRIGAKVIQGSATDGNGCKVTLTVLNNLPQAAFTYAPTNPTDTDVISFTDSSSDFDGTVVAWAWSFGDGTTSTQRNPTHRYADNGVYSVSLAVTDNDGATGSVQWQVTVTNVAPSAAFTYAPTNPTDTDVISFTDSSSDPDGTIGTWAWDFGDGTTSAEQRPAHRFTAPGEYTVTLTVTDNDGAAASATAVLAVASSPPPQGADRPIPRLVYGGRRLAFAQGEFLVRAKILTDFTQVEDPQAAEAVTFPILDLQGRLVSEPAAAATMMTSVASGHVELPAGIYFIDVAFRGTASLNPASAGPELAVVCPPDAGTVAAWGALDEGERQFGLLAALDDDGLPDLAQFAYRDAATDTEVVSTSVQAVSRSGGVCRLSGVCAVCGVHGYDFEVELAPANGGWVLSLAVGNGLRVQGYLDPGACVLGPSG